MSKMERRVIAVATVWTLATFSALSAGEDHKDHEHKHDGKQCEQEVGVCVRYMAKELRNKGWIGIEMQKTDEQGRRIVTRVVENSPAQRAGFLAGDVLVAFDDVTLADGDEAKYAAIKKLMVPGKILTVRVERAGEPRDLEVELGRIPDVLLAQWVGQHMLDAHSALPEDTDSP